MESVNNYVRPRKNLVGGTVNRKEATALLSELGSKELVNPNLVILEQRQLNFYQLKIKGDYNLPEIQMFLKNKFSIEEIKDFLIIY